MSTSENHEGLADELERETEALKRESDRVGDEISETRSDWEAKRADPNVPGAPPPPAAEEGEDDPRGTDEPASAGSGE